MDALKKAFADVAKWAGKGEARSTAQRLGMPVPEDEEFAEAPPEDMTVEAAQADVPGVEKPEGAEAGALPAEGAPTEGLPEGLTPEALEEALRLLAEGA